MNCLTIERDNIIGRYLARTLEPELEEAFELHYFQCDHCLEALEASRAAAGVLQRPKRRKPVRAWLLAAAAAIMVVYGISIATRDRQPAVEAVLSARFDAPEYAPPVLRGTETAAGQQFQRAMEFYERRQYAEAIPGLRAALALDPKAAAPRFFLGACYVLTGKVNEGIAELKTVAAGDSPFAAEAREDVAKASQLLP